MELNKNNKQVDNKKSILLMNILNQEEPKDTMLNKLKADEKGISKKSGQTIKKNLNPKIKTQIKPTFKREIIQKNKQKVPPANLSKDLEKKTVPTQKSILKKTQSKSKEVFNYISKQNMESTRRSRSVESFRRGEYCSNHVDLIENMLGKLNINSKEARISYFLKLKEYINKTIEKDQITPHNSHLLNFQDELMKSKLDQMTAEINDLKQELNMSRELPNDKNNSVVKQEGKNVSNDILTLNKAKKNFDNPEEIIINLRKELMASNYRCNLLENLLEQKSRQGDQYMNIFKEINDNVNKLMKEMEEKTDQTQSKNGVKKSCDFSDLFENVLSLKQNLLRFKSTFKTQLKQRPKKADNLFTINSNLKQKFPKISDNKPINKTKPDSQKDTTVDSDTLIDADSSFESINLDSLDDQFVYKLKANIRQEPLNLRNFSSLKNRDSLINAEVSEDEYDDDEDEDRVELNMNDLSISTMQLTENSSEIDAYHSNLLNDDDEFDRDLIKLDDKISRVKKTLNHMKCYNDI